MRSLAPRLCHRGPSHSAGPRIPQKLSDVISGSQNGHVDPLTPEERSRHMARVRGTNTKPEMALRRSLRAAGATGYRIDLRSLPGRPDVAFTRWKVAVFVDGAFWHGRADRWHPDRANDYWRTKISTNMSRDREVETVLQGLGWSVVRVWDDEVMRDPDGAALRVVQALGEAGHPRFGVPSPDLRLRGT